MIAEQIIAEIKRKNLKEFLSTTEGLSFNGNNACLCIFHDDHHPSLTVTQKDGGIWAWYCHGCNIGGSIIDFVMQKYGMGFLEATTFLQEHYHLNEKPKKKAKKNTEITENDIERKHDYCDADGNFLWQKIKLKDGTFRCRQKENGKWIFSLDGITHIPYKWSEIKDESAIYLCEGERDADTMLHLGYHATTSPFGKGSWPDELTPHFTGKEVNIVYDVGNDKDAEETASKLSETCSKVWILKVPLDKTEADVTDYVNQFKDDETKRTKLLDLCGSEFDKAQVEITKPSVHHDGTEDEGTWAKTVTFIKEEIDHGEKFSLNELSQHLGYSYGDTEERRTISKAVGYLIKKGDVTKAGKLGIWKKAPAGLVAINLMPDENEEYFTDFRVPILDGVRINRGDVLLFSGYTSTGKTAFALNFVRLNQHLFEGVDYFSTQSGQVRKRILNFKKYHNLEEKDWAFSLYERVEDFATVIDPSHFSVIDFLDALDGDYSKSGGLVSQIHNRVENKPGVVLIFSQKHPHSDDPMGGAQLHSFTNLSVALDDIGDEGSKKCKQLKILKAKIDPQHEDKIIRYQIEDEGTTIKPLTPLEYPSRLDAVKRRFKYE